MAKWYRDTLSAMPTYTFTNGDYNSLTLMLATTAEEIAFKLRWF
jgi:hypothetical protein